MLRSPRRRSSLLPCAALAAGLGLTMGCTSADIRQDSGTDVAMTATGGAGAEDGGAGQGGADAPVEVGGAGGQGGQGGFAGTQGGGGAGGETAGGHGGVLATGGTAGGKGGGGGGRGGATGGAMTGGAGGMAGGGGQAPLGGGGGGGSGAAGGGGSGGQAPSCAGGPVGGAISVINATLPGQLVVSELMHDPVVAHDDAGEWFELFNPSPTTGYELASCAIKDISGNQATIAGSLVVPPCGYATFAAGGNTGSDETAKAGFTPTFVYGIGVKFGNDHADGVRVICGGQEVARFIYSDADAKDLRYKGATYSVSPAHLDATNDTPGSFCPGASPYHTLGANVDDGTPGAPNPACSP